MMIRAVTALLLVLAGAGEEEPATAVSVEFEPQEARLGEPVTATIRARGEPGVSYKLPEEVDLGPFVELGRSQTRSGEFDVITLKLVVYEEVGEVKLPVVQLEARAPDGGAVAAMAVPEATLKIKSMLEGVEKPEPRDVAGPVPVWVSDYRPLVFAGLVLLWLLCAWILKRSRTSGRAPQRLADLPPPRLAHQIAYDKLHRIVEDDLLRQGKFREYFIRVSEAVREYLGNRYGFFAMDLTSRELLDELRDRPTPGLQIGSLKQLLQNSDLVKFARLRPTDEMSSDAINGAYSLVNATRRIPEEDSAQAERETA